MVSAFSNLIDGIRGLFRSRWEDVLDEEPATGGSGLLDVLCVQLAGTWHRPRPDRAAKALESGETVLLEVRSDDDFGGAVVSLRLARTRWGHISSSTPHQVGSLLWPEGCTVGVVELEGDPEALCCLLDPPTRTSLPHTLMVESLRFVDSAVELEVAEGDTDLVGVVHRTRAGLDLLRQLVDAKREARLRLVERATEDPERAVRHHAARLLGESPDSFAEPGPILLAVAQAGDLEVAAIVAGALPHADPEELAALAMDRFGRPRARACAAVCLCQLTTPPPEALIACLELRPEWVVTLAPDLLGVDLAEVREATLSKLLPFARLLRGVDLSDRLRDRLLKALRDVGSEPALRVLVAWRDTVRNDLLTIQVGETLIESGRPDLAGASAQLLSGLLRNSGSRLRPRAVELLTKVHRDSVPRELLRELFEVRDAAVWRSALELALAHQRRSVAADLPTFAHWMELDQTEALVGLLGQLGGPDAEAALLKLLGTGRDREVLMSAAIALGQCGTLEAVEALVGVEERGGDLGREARFSIEQIQLRVGATGRGGLSIAGEVGGQLAIAGDEGGHLAIAGEEVGLALTED